MLVLSRKKGESIMIGDEIELVILETEGETVRVGIKAPKQVQVYRQEVYQAIKQSNQEASRFGTNLHHFASFLRNEKNSGN